MDPVTSVLTVNRNVMHDNGMTDISYICTVFAGGSIRKAECSYDYVQSMYEYKRCDISGESLFTYTDGVVNPNSIRLHVNTVNVNATASEYKTASGWAPIPMDAEGQIVVSAADDQKFMDGKCLIRVLTDDDDVYDTFTLYKISNDRSGNQAIQYYSYIRYSAYDDGL